MTHSMTLSMTGDLNHALDLELEGDSLDLFAEELPAFVNRMAPACCQSTASTVSTVESCYACVFCVACRCL